MALHLLDTTALIAHARGDASTLSLILTLLRRGHGVATTCVNVAEIERGAQPDELRRYRQFLDRLRFLVTTREAAQHAGRYQRTLSRRGVTLHTADALIAGTARAHGAVLVTDNLSDFPMTDIRVLTPEDTITALS